MPAISPATAMAMAVSSTMIATDPMVGMMAIIILAIPITSMIVGAVVTTGMNGNAAIGKGAGKSAEAMMAGAATGATGAM